MSGQLVAASVPAGSVVQWGFLTVTVANLMVILAILLPFPVADDEDPS